MSKSGHSAQCEGNRLLKIRVTTEVFRKVTISWMIANKPIPKEGATPSPKNVAGLVLSYYHRMRDALLFAEYRHAIGFPGDSRYLVLTRGIQFHWGKTGSYGVAVRPNDEDQQPRWLHLHAIQAS